MKGSVKIMLSTNFVAAKHSFGNLFAHVHSPLFRKSFDIDNLPDRATVTVCGLGFYRIFINGNDITKGFLAPYISNPDDIVYYDAYDVAKYLQKGENVIGIMLGNGFFNQVGGYVWNFDTAKWRGPLRFALAYESQTGEEKSSFEATDGFKCCDGPYEFDDVRMGVVYDARLEKLGWSAPGFDDLDWKDVIFAEKPRGEARLCEADPILPQYEITPKKITFEGDGCYFLDGNSFTSKPVSDAEYKNAYLYDFGENAAGTFRLKINAKAGQVITLRMSEFLFDGKFNMNTIANRISDQYRVYSQRVVYTCKEGENVFVPDFTYFGYQYVLVEGITEEQATADLLTYIVMNSDIKRRGNFSCSDEMANKLYDAAIRSDLANFYYFPTDCPHREKNGWTGDASVSAEQLLLNFDAGVSYREWMRSVCKAQNDAGALPGIVPTSGWGFHWGNGPIWDEVCVNLPYYTYRFNGDTQILKEAAPTIIRYLNYLTTRRDERGLVAIGLPDWCQPKHNPPTTPLEVSDSIVCYDICVKSEKIFDIIGWDMQKKFACELAKSFRAAIREHLIDFSTMTVKGSCQTAQAAAIEIGIFEPGELESARKRLIEFVYEKDVHHDCGILGLRYIFHALANAGRSDLALKMITRTDNVSYGYWIAHGATSLWETFCEMDGHHNSKNHHFFGDFISFFIQRLAGLQPNPYIRDIAEFRIAPDFDCGLTSASAHYDSVHGRVSVKWNIEENGKVTLKIKAPEKITGYIELPNFYRFEDGKTIIPIKSGKYNVIK